MYLQIQIQIQSTIGQDKVIMQRQTVVVIIVVIIKQHSTAGLCCVLYRERDWQLSILREAVRSLFEKVSTAMKKGELGCKRETRSWSDATRVKEGGKVGEEKYKCKCTNTTRQVCRFYNKVRNCKKSQAGQEEGVTSQRRRRRPTESTPSRITSPPPSKIASQCSR